MGQWIPDLMEQFDMGAALSPESSAAWPYRAMVSVYFAERNVSSLSPEPEVPCWDFAADC